MNERIVNHGFTSTAAQRARFDDALRFEIILLVNLPLL